MWVRVTLNQYNYQDLDNLDYNIVNELISQLFIETPSGQYVPEKPSAARKSSS